MKVVKLLIVDDHPVVRDGLKMMLESNKKKFDFVVNEASNAEEAIRLITNNDFDIIIMDYKLPDKTGDIITKEILGVKSGLKIIGLSNYDEEIYASEMLNAGAKGYVLKNIDSEELIRAIEKVLSGELYYSAEIANRISYPYVLEKNQLAQALLDLSLLNWNFDIQKLEDSRKHAMDFFSCEKYSSNIDNLLI